MTPSKYQAAVYAHVTENWTRLRTFRRDPAASLPRNLVVQAGPGAGKSLTLREMCAYVPDARVEVVSFTARVARDAAPKLPSNASSITLHAVGKRALEGFWGRPFRKGPERQERDGELAEDKVRRIVARLKESGQVGQYEPAGLVCKLVSKAKGVGLVPDGAAVGQRDPQPCDGLVPDEDRAWLDLMDHHGIDYRDPLRLVTAARAALRHSLLHSSSVIDFDDMTYLAAVLRTLAFPRRDVVCVDELQDLDAVQRRLVVRMCAPGTQDRALFVGVGDCRQAIFGWRGAALDSMDLCAADLGCDRLPLPVCYRCPSEHVALANEVALECGDGLPLVEARPGAPAGEVVDYGLIHENGFDPSCQDCLDGESECHHDRHPRPTHFQPGDAVVCRKNAPLARLALWLVRHRVPCRLLGRDFGRGLSSLLLGTKQAGAQDAVTALRSRLVRQESQDARQQLDEPSESAARLRDAVEVLEALLEGHDHDPLVEELAREVELLFGSDDPGGDGVVTLSSIHRFKGGEADRVWWLDSESVRPHPRAPAWAQREALHLRYVALTRARKALILCSSENFGG